MITHTVTRVCTGMTKNIDFDDDDYPQSGNDFDEQIMMFTE